MISHLVKHALVTLARDAAAEAGKPAPPVPHSRADWAALARQTGVKVIHVAERDTQLATAEAARKPGEFVNTWSVDGFISEGLYQPSELGWGSHEVERRENKK